MDIADRVLCGGTHRMNGKLTQKYPPGSFDVDKGIFSWSAYNVWTKGGPGEFARKYIYRDADDINPRMETGRIVDDMMNGDTEQDDEVMEHLRTFLPHYEHTQYEIEVPFNGITLVMHLDGLNLKPLKIGELKTGITPWTLDRARKHEQLDWYALGVHLKFKVDPATVPIVLTWAQTEWPMMAPRPEPTGEIENFEIRKTLLDCVTIGKKIMVAWKQASEFARKERESIGL